MSTNSVAVLPRSNSQPAGGLGNFGTCGRNDGEFIFLDSTTDKIVAVIWPTFLERQSPTAECAASTTALNEEWETIEETGNCVSQVPTKCRKVGGHRVRASRRSQISGLLRVAGSPNNSVIDFTRRTTSDADAVTASDVEKLTRRTASDAENEKYDQQYQQRLEREMAKHRQVIEESQKKNELERAQQVDKKKKKKKKKKKRKKHHKPHKPRRSADTNKVKYAFEWMSYAGLCAAHAIGKSVGAFLMGFGLLNQNMVNDGDVKQGAHQDGLGQWRNADAIMAQMEEAKYREQLEAEAKNSPMSPNSKSTLSLLVRGNWLGRRQRRRRLRAIKQALKRKNSKEKDEQQPLTEGIFPPPPLPPNEEWHTPR